MVLFDALSQASICSQLFHREFTLHRFIGRQVLRIFEEVLVMLAVEFPEVDRVESKRGTEPPIVGELVIRTLSLATCEDEGTFVSVRPFIS